jgi:hypothetical protein
MSGCLVLSKNRKDVLTIGIDKVCQNDNKMLAYFSEAVYNQ